MRRLIMLSMVIMVGAMASLFTLASFVDTETSSGNSFAAGALDLLVSDNNEGFGDGVTQTWVMSNMIPGGSEVTNNMQFQNAGTMAADHVELAFSYEIDEASYPVGSDTNPGSAWQDMARMLEVRFMIYDGNVLHAVLSDANGNGWLDLEDLAMPQNAAVLDNLRAPNPPPVGAESLVMTVAFRPEAGNDLQGDILTMTVMATLNQDASQ